MHIIELLYHFCLYFLFCLVGHILTIFYYVFLEEIRFVIFLHHFEGLVNFFNVLYP